MLLSFLHTKSNVFYQFTWEWANISVKYNVVLYWSWPGKVSLILTSTPGSDTPLGWKGFSELLQGTSAEARWHQGLNSRPSAAGWSSGSVGGCSDGSWWLFVLWQAQTPRSWGTVGNWEWRRLRWKKFSTKWLSGWVGEGQGDDKRETSHGLLNSVPIFWFSRLSCVCCTQLWSSPSAVVCFRVRSWARTRFCLLWWLTAIQPTPASSPTGATSSFSVRPCP